MKVRSIGEPGRVGMKNDRVSSVCIVSCSFAGFLACLFSETVRGGRERNH